jgi:heterotetrameric sarcosine oxidase delta subunit
MLLIRCPWCGERDHTEFMYGGDAKATRPAEDASERDWVDYVYFRDNVRGPHHELWHHVQGCRQWLRVVRDTMTHAITEVTLAGAPMQLQ